MAGAVVLVGRDDGVVRPNLDHGLGRLCRAAVDGKRVRLGVHGPPVGDGGLKRGFNLPVLDQVLDEVLEGAGSMRLLLCCTDMASAYYACHMPYLWYSHL